MTTPEHLEEIEKPIASNNAEMSWASDAIAELIRRLDLKYIAMNPGASYRGLHDSFVNYLGNRDPQMLLTLQEGHAVAIAHGYAKVTGKPMGVFLHSNVGLMHGLMQIFNAWCSRVPMMVFGATGPVDADARRPYIDWIHTSQDQGALLRNYTKWDSQPSSVPAAFEALLRARQMSCDAPQGPVYVCFDAGLQERPLDTPPALPDLDRYAPATPPSPSSDDIARAADRLARSKRPLIIIGRASRDPGDWDRRVAFAEMLGANVHTEMRVGSSFPTDHPLHPCAPSIAPSADALAMIRQADVILVLDSVDPGGWFKLAFGEKPPSAFVINCSLDSLVHNGWSMDHQKLPAADLRIFSDTDTTIASFFEPVKQRIEGTPKRWTANLAKPAGELPGKSKQSLRSVELSQALANIRETKKLTLVRVHNGWASGPYHFRDPLDYLGSDGGGGLGAGPGMAIGSALALRGSGRVVATVLGDGDFTQGATALWTAAHYRIPVLIIVANNKSNFNDEIHQANVARQRQRPVENKWIGMRLDDPPIDLCALARAQGVEAFGPVTDMAALERALTEAIEVVEAGRPCLIDAVIDIDA